MEIDPEMVAHAIRDLIKDAEEKKMRLERQIRDKRLEIERIDAKLAAFRFTEQCALERRASESEGERP